MANKTRKTLFNNHVALPGADLYRGDCLAVLPTLPGGFGALVTDPPYSSGGQSKGDRARSTGDKYLNTGASNYPDCCSAASPVVADPMNGSRMGPSQAATISSISGSGLPTWWSLPPASGLTRNTPGE